MWQWVEQIQASRADELLLLTAIAGLICYGVLKWIDRSHRKTLPMRIIRRSVKPVTLMVLTLGTRLSLEAMPFEEDDASARVIDALDHGLSILLIAALVWLTISAMAGLRAHILSRYNMQTADNLRARKVHTQVNVFFRLMAVFVIIIGFAFMLMTFEGVDNIGASLLASAGVTGIIIGFAAQKTLGTIMAGIQIAITQPIRLEDAVVVEGEWGWIEEITLTYVVIRIWDLRRLVVPITYFIETPFQNWTRTSAEILGDVVLYLNYDVPLDELRAEFKHILDNTELWNKRVQVVQVIDTTEKTQKVRLLMTGKDSPTTWDLRCHVRERLISWLQMYYPNSLPQLRVTLEQSSGENGHSAPI